MNKVTIWLFAVHEDDQVQFALNASSNLKPKHDRGFNGMEDEQQQQQPQQCQQVTVTQYGLASQLPQFLGACQPAPMPNVQP